MAWYDWLIGGGDNPVPGIGSLFDSGQSGSAADGGQSWDDIINKYSYKPQYTAQTEQGLYDLFTKTNGSMGVNDIPFDIGLPTTGLYDALTRSQTEKYLGTGNWDGSGLNYVRSGPEGGLIADTRAYYNNMGIPEYAANQERLGMQDLNNSLLDTAAELNNVQKDRLLQVLGLGANVGSNLYSQNLAQHRFNTGIAAQGQQFDAGMNQAIQSANSNSLAQLLSGAGALATTAYTGNPALGSMAGQGINSITGSNNAAVLGSGSLSQNYSPYSGSGSGLGSLGQNSKLFS